MSDRLDRLYEPQWAVGWAWARVLWVVAATTQYGLDVLAIGDVWGTDDMLFTSGSYRLAEVVVVTPGWAAVWWASIMASIAVVAWGGRATKAGLVAFLFTAGSWLAWEAVNVKAHDRLLFFITLTMLMSPVDERGLVHKKRSPFARWTMVLMFCAAYGATGFHKAFGEPTWWTDGSVLAHHLVRPFHGEHAFGVWLSTQWWLLPILTITAVLWECAFPFLIWFKRANVPLLLFGLVFHASLTLWMDVGPFALVAWTAYPVLLHPERMQALHRWTMARAGRAPRAPQGNP